MKSEIKSSHTPGPWTSDLTGPFTLGGDSREVVALDSEGMVTRSICSCMLDTDSFPNGKYFLEDKANIQIIAAAPDLLKALQIAERCLDSINDFPNCVETDHCNCQRCCALRSAREAISKAEGQ